MSGESIFKSLFQNGNREAPSASPKVGFGDAESDTAKGSPSMNEMSSLTPPPSGQAVSTTPAPAPVLTDDDSTSQRSLDELLLEKMDSAVSSFSAVMSDDSVLRVETTKGEVTTVTETPRYTFSERMKAAEFVRDWIVRRRKLQPVTALDDDAPNITALREAIRLQIEETMEQKRVVTLPPKKAGRPTKEEAAQWAEAKEALAKAKFEDEQAEVLQPLEPVGDDDELKRALRGKK
jgi:hypothetical protein